MILLVKEEDFTWEQPSTRHRAHDGDGEAGGDREHENDKELPGALLHREFFVDAAEEGEKGSGHGMASSGEKGVETGEGGETDPPSGGEPFPLDSIVEETNPEHMQRHEEGHGCRKRKGSPFEAWTADGGIVSHRLSIQFLFCAVEFGKAAHGKAV